MDSLFLITDDGQGVAQILADELRRRGKRPVLVQAGLQVGEVGRDLYEADLTDPTGVAELFELVRPQGSVTGLIHLLPLKAGVPFEAMDFEAWRRRLQLDVKSLFYLAKAAGPGLRRAAEAGEGLLVAATAMGGSFASDGEEESFFPGQGGVAGLIKTLALEWPTVRCKVVDMDRGQSSSTMASRLLGEIATRDGQPEVCYVGSRRRVIRPRPASWDQDDTSGVTIDSSSVVLVTGGARGITAEVIGELARRYQPTLVVVGRAPMPSAEESPDIAGLTAPNALKAVLMDRMRRVGQPFTPGQVEATYTRLLHDREMRGNLTAMRQAGATVRYCQVDVRDAQAFALLIDEIYQSYGRLDGAIHGAGIIEDKLLEDKSPDSFDRVFDTKVDSAFILSRTLRADSLKFLAFFSSVAGLFGNRGQSDYAAANEVLNKLAAYLDRRWPGRVVAINWGPWQKTGMVSDEVQRQFAERGVQLIPPSAGCRAFDKEIRFGRKGQVAVVIGDGPWRGDWAGKPPSSVSALPLLGGVPVNRGDGGSFELIHGLDSARDRYLEDHRLDGKPVFPVAMAMELMAEVVQHGWPARTMVSIRSLQVLRGIVLGDGARQIRVAARRATSLPQAGPTMEVDVEIAEVGQPRQPFYRATIQMDDRLPAPPPYDPTRLSALRPFPMTVEEAYRRWLFHGPCFQGISKIEGIGEHGIVGILLPSSPHECLAGDPAGQWLIDPVLLDSSFQLGVLWGRAEHDVTPLPSRFTSYRRFRSPSGPPVRCCIHAQARPGGQTLIFDIWLLDSAGGAVGLLEEMECSCSQALNRLAGAVTSIRRLP